MLAYSYTLEYSLTVICFFYGGFQPGLIGLLMASPSTDAVSDCKCSESVSVLCHTSSSKQHCRCFEQFCVETKPQPSYGQ